MQDSFVGRIIVHSLCGWYQCNSLVWCKPWYPKPPWFIMNFQLIDTISRLSFWELRFFGPCQRTLESYRNPCEHRKLPRKSQIRKSWHRCGSQCLTHQRLRQSKPSKIAQFPKSIICCSWPWQFYSQCLSEISFQHRGIFLPHPSSIVDKSWCFGLLVLRCILPGENGAVGRRLRGATRFLHVEERLRMTWGCLAKSVRFMDFYLSLSQE